MTEPGSPARPRTARWMTWMARRPTSCRWRACPVVVTGAMSGSLEALSRNEMNELIERAGGKASSSVSAKTSLVVAGEKAGSKPAKAESLGVRIATPEEFAELVTSFL